MNGIFRKLDELFDTYVNVWEDVCNIESPTVNKAGVDAVGAYFIAMAKERGWDVDVCKQSVSGNAVSITMNPDAAGSMICLSGHLDTVHPVGCFGSPAVHLDEEKIYGPGVTDCKGGVVAAFFAMDALRKSGFRDRPVRLILQSDEEVGSRTSNYETVKYMCEQAKGAAAFLNLEGASPDEICLSRKGIMTYVFTVQGQEAHSSCCATMGANAILDAAHKIIELEKIKDDEGLTCCCSVIQGGTVVNTVPGKCVFKVNVRFANAAQLAWIENHVQTVADTVHVPGCTCTVVPLSRGRIAMEYTQRNQDLVDAINDIFVKNGLSPVKVARRKGGSDAAYLTAAGIPCVDNLGVMGGGIHSPEEYGIIDSLLLAAKRIASIVVNL